MLEAVKWWFFTFAFVIFGTFASIENAKVKCMSKMLGKLHFLLLLLSSIENGLRPSLTFTRTRTKMYFFSFLFLHRPLRDTFLLQKRFWSQFLARYIFRFTRTKTKIHYKNVFVIIYAPQFLVQKGTKRHEM